MNYEEYIRLKDYSNFASKKIKEQEAEIERLKKREQECIDHYLVQCKYASEMESKYISANYVINELEKYLKKVIETSSEHERITCSFVLQYLQELKGSDKE